jgi:RNA polymerase sigma factor (TIGR02999 family)
MPHAEIAPRMVTGFWKKIFESPRATRVTKRTTVPAWICAMHFLSLPHPARMNPELTRLLHRMGEGSAEAGDELVRAVYAELRRMAQTRLASEGAPTLQATELVHEAWLRMGGSTAPDDGWENRRHFFGAAAESMRRILVDRARARSSQKRGGHAPRLSLDSAAEFPSADTFDPDLLVALDAALTELEMENASAARVVKLRFFAGLTVPESAALLGVDERTVIRKWKFAQAWLYQRLSQPAPH